MPEPIYIWEYLLQSGSALNAASIRRTFPGALLRVGAGFSCLHPWPEFGDDPLEVQLQSLAAGQPTQLAQLALDAARLDGEARTEGRSLLEGLEIPQSHYSWSFAQETQPQIERLLQEGWPALKAKGFPHWGETLTFLEACERVKGSHPLRYRIDFNGCLDAIQFHRFIEFMPVKVYRSIDFIEDPYPYDPTAWAKSRERWGLPLALDKGWQEGETGFDHVVVKPARRDWRRVAERHPNHPLVLTSAMDHPLGQAFAAYQAAVARKELGGRIGQGGLCTQHLFQPNAFSEQMSATGGHLRWDLSGGGLGFGEVLEHLPWRRLD